MTGMVSYKELDVPEAMAYVLEVVGQDKVAGVIAIGAVIGIMAVIFAYIYATTRVFFAMSRDGLLPESFAKINKKTEAPTFTVWLTGIGSAFNCWIYRFKRIVEFSEYWSVVNICDGWCVSYYSS